MDPIINRMLHPAMFRIPWLLRRFRYGITLVVVPVARKKRPKVV